ncbi:hypothetical protein [Paraburkholderia sp. PGU19]|uniref:hypothetical protein n=1 Tax=Paraburkholderia sp. PGU19 TaxID=2735434 RepID=UPI001FB1658F|nr:hypothetical protein [Paraburkholderia sp. PGU19]
MVRIGPDLMERPPDVSFLIDPIHKTVTSVQDGYARAGELIDTDLTDTATLWGDAADSDTSVQVIVADDSLANNPISRGFFKVTLELENVRLERVLAGKAVLNAYGSPPPDINEQVKTLKAVRERVSFIRAEDAFQWFEENTGVHRFRWRAKTGLRSARGCDSAIDSCVSPDDDNPAGRNHGSAAFPLSECSTWR